VLALLRVQGRLEQSAAPSGGQVAATFGLYAVIWWAWLGQAFYDTRFDPDDVPHRLSVLVATAGGGALALGAANVPHSLVLPIGYLIVRGTLIALYLRVRNSSPDVRKLTAVYFAGFGLGWLMWLGSLAAPAGVRPVLWIAAMSVELLTPWAGRRRLVRIPVDRSHLPERIGLFTIILLGVTLTNLLDAVAGRPTFIVIASAAVAFVIPACVWWVYTTFVTTGLALRRLSAGLGYSSVHGFLGAALLLLGWALEQVLEEIVAGSAGLPGMLRLLLGVSLVAWMLCGLTLQWVSLGSVLPRRVWITAAGAGAVGLIVALVPGPTVVLVLLAATLVGYAVMVSRHIVRLSGERGP
jgi:low temperature requirement protein LtrA